MMTTTTTVIIITSVESADSAISLSEPGDNERRLITLHPRVIFSRLAKRLSARVHLAVIIVASTLRSSLHYHYHYHDSPPPLLLLPPLFYLRLHPLRSIKALSIFIVERPPPRKRVNASTYQSSAVRIDL